MSSGGIVSGGLLCTGIAFYLLIFACRVASRRVSLLNWILHRYGHLCVGIGINIYIKFSIGTASVPVSASKSVLVMAHTPDSCNIYIQSIRR